MARLNRLSRISDKSLPNPPSAEPKLVAFKIKIKNPAPQRQLSLLTISVILNTLLWSSITCAILALFQIASDSEDHSNILPGVLTLVSAIVTVAYTIVHTTYSVKQRALTYQQLDPVTIKKTTYIINRLVVSLCVLWLLTAGWDMILVARRPSCLGDQLEGQAWEVGITCVVSRVGMALAMVSLVASLTLFGLMAAVRRPFEAHLFAYGQRQSDTGPAPSNSRRLSEGGEATEKLVPDISMSVHVHTRSTSNLTNADVETLDLNASSRPASILQSEFPARDRIGVFTSPFAPPPLPPAFMVAVGRPPPPCRHSTLDPMAHRRRLSLTPRTDALLAPAAYVPYSIPIEYSASAQRAVYPDTSAPYRSVSASRSRSQPHLRSLSACSNRHRYSSSLVSLSRPHRLSSLTPVPHLECSSRSDTLNSSGGISEAGGSPKSRGSVGREKLASAAEIVHGMDGTNIVYAMNGNTPMPGTRASPRKHCRTVSAPDASGGAGGQQGQARRGERMAMGWKPQLSSSQSSAALRTPLPGALNKLMRSASAELLGRFGQERAVEEMKWKTGSEREMEDRLEDIKWKVVFEREIEDRLNDLHVLPFPEDERKSISTDAETLRDSYERSSVEDERRFEDAKEVLVVGGRHLAFV